MVIFKLISLRRLLFQTVFAFWNSSEPLLFTFILLYVYNHYFTFILCGICAFLAIAYNLEDHFVFHPNEPSESRYYVEQPSKYDLPFECVRLQTSDGVLLHSYLLKQKNALFSTSPTLIFFHGNAGNIGQRLIHAKYFYNYCEFNVLMVEYRGYGRSDGVPSEHGFYLDAEAACSYLYSRNDIDKNKIILFGQSIGGAVAIHAAVSCKYNIYALIVENTFTSLPEIGKELFGAIPFMQFMPDVCSKYQYRNIDKIKLATIPCCFISGQADTMVPPKMMAKLYEKCNTPFKRLVCIENGDHNATWICPGYFQSVNKFMNELSNYKKQANYMNAEVWSIN